MFNDKFGLTQAVLDGRKTMTRRIEKSPRYHVGEEVAIAQCYADIADYSPQDPVALDTANGLDDFYYHDYKSEKGWNNKMFTKAEYMPHCIKITNVCVERLQDISDDDCICEGVKYRPSVRGYVVDGMYFSRAKHMLRTFITAKAAFAALIDKISGKGTWDSNPWVFVYEFELVK